MATQEASPRAAPPVDETLRRVVVTYRLLTLAWVWILIAVNILTGQPGNRVVLGATLALTAVWSGATSWAGTVGTTRVDPWRAESISTASPCPVVKKPGASEFTTSSAWSKSRKYRAADENAG